MKGYFDKFYELIHKNSLKRRRMISLMLVLSLFVSTGVLWSLRDIGITFVNDAMCGFEEHTHTDDCYENVLVCGLEEDEEHTHTEECYENTLICGFEEHIHLTSCYTDEELPREQEEETEGIVYINSDDYSEEDMNEESLLSEMGFDIPDIVIPEEIQLLADKDPNPKPIGTYDNTLDGIKINFFDYGTELLDRGESTTTNNRGETVADNTNVNHYTSPKEVGINGPTLFKESEYNGYTKDEDKENYMNQFLLFFSYGTPASSTKEVDGKKMVNPTINNYSGSWVDGTDPERYPAGNVSGNRPVQGIVAPVLSEINNKMMPMLSGKTWGIEHLFGEYPIHGWEDGKPSYQDSAADPTKTFYKNVTHLMQKNEETGKYSYYSDQNYAYLDTTPTTDSNGDYSAGTFEVYDQTYRIYEGKGESHNNRPIGFFPFDEYPTQYDSTHEDIDVFKDDKSKNNIYGNPTHKTRKNDADGEMLHDYNHHFGMTMEATFNMSGDVDTFKGNDIEFTYSGDDDMWVFIDDILVLDLGGIHEPAAGQINFTDGYVLVQDNAYGQYNKEQLMDFSLRDKSGPTNLLEGSDVLTKYMRGLDDNSVKMDVYYLADIYAKNAKDGKKYNDDGSEITWEQNKEHTIKIFYLERGGSYSNLALEFCLPFAENLSIEKEVDDESNGNEFDGDGQGFKYQLFFRDEDGKFTAAANRDYVYANVAGKKGKTDDQGIFYLKKGEKIVFPNTSPDLEYYVVELGVDSEIYDDVRIVDSNKNDYSTVSDHGAGNKYDDETGQWYYRLEDNNYVRFVNHVNYEKTNLIVNKDWVDTTETNHDNVKVKFKLYRVEKHSDGTVTKTPVVYNNRMTFVLEAKDYWQMEFKDLPVEYGNHKYTYEVVEVDIPSGYNVSYSEFNNTGINATLTITNTDKSNVDICVKKDWENVDDETLSKMSIKLVLKRLVSKNEGNLPTSLTIKLVGNNGADLKQYDITEDQELVYENGSLEFSLDLPEGVTYVTNNPDANFDAGSRYLVPDTLKLSKISETGNFFEVSNLQGGSNVVTIYLNVDGVVSGGGNTGGGDTPSDEPLIHHTFEQPGVDYGFTGNNERYLWQGRNAVVESSGYCNYAGSGNSLVAKSRVSAWNGASGPRLYLNKDLFQKGKTYTFSVYVQFDDVQSDGANLSRINDVIFKMTLADGDTNFETMKNFAEVTAAKGYNTWTKLSGSVKIPDEYNEDEMFIFIETPTDNSSVKVMNFRIDEFVAVEGEADVSVDTSGNVTVTRAGGNNSGGNSGNSSGGKVVHHAEFAGSGTNGLGGTGWSQSGGPTYEKSTQNGDNYLVIKGRTKTYDGISLQDLSFLQVGHTYKFEATVQLNGDLDNIPCIILQRYLKNYADVGENQYLDICTGNTDTSSWNGMNGDYPGYSTQDIVGTYKIPQGADLSATNFTITIGSDDNSKTMDFRIRSVTITDITYETTVEYTISINEDSATNPLTEGDFEEDNEFEKSVTLNKDGWTYHWTNDQDAKGEEWYITEEPGWRYLYYIAKEIIYDENGGIIAEYEIRQEDFDKQISEGKLALNGDKQQDYEVSFKGNFVSTNKDNPIVICNKYIWYRLPETGGSGTGGIYLLGLALITMGTTSFIFNYRRKRRRV